ncbi:hypothetical protein BHE74_00054206 [Ensete ventricosum]|nr:hypothetical protein BHE74_00054206 [Ensete ventricosum]RZS19043.1 hypothetical protein BHM03_00051384 [Ensete ventricosum]
MASACRSGGYMRRQRPQEVAARGEAARGNPAARAAACMGGRWQERSPAGAALMQGGVARLRGAVLGQRQWR